MRGRVDALDPSKTAGIGTQAQAGEEIGTFSSNQGSRSEPRPPEGARSLSELKPGQRLQRARKGCGVEGGCNFGKNAPGMKPHPRHRFSLGTTAFRPLAFHSGRTLRGDLRAAIRAPPPGLCELYGLSVLRLRGWK